MVRGAVGGPKVWERMNQEIERFNNVKRMRENPDKFNLVSKVDTRTGQPLFQPKLINKKKPTE